MKEIVFFDLAYQNFLSLPAQEVKKFYRIADFTFCLHFAGEALVDRLTLALAHLEMGPRDCVDLNVCIWDSASIGVPPLKFPWTSNFYDLRGEVIQYNTDRISTVVDIHTQVLHLFDRERNLALYWIEDEKKLPWWTMGSPLQLIFHWWMRSRSFQLTHAAVVGTLQGGVLLAGKSGSGKSTTSLVCIQAGMQLLSEDYCVLSNAPEITAHSIYNSAKIGEKTLEWFPEFKKYIRNVQRTKEEKAFLFHHQFQPEKILECCSLKAVLTLQIEAGAESWLEPIEPHQAIGPLSVSTMWQLTHTGPVVFNHLKRITEALPCYRLHLGHDLPKVAQIVGQLL